MLARALGETLAHLTRNGSPQLLDDRTGLANADQRPANRPELPLRAALAAGLGAPLTPRG